MQAKLLAQLRCRLDEPLYMIYRSEEGLRHAGPIPGHEDTGGIRCGSKHSQDNSNNLGGGHDGSLLLLILRRRSIPNGLSSQQHINSPRLALLIPSHTNLQ